MRRAVEHSVVVVKAALARCRVARITEPPAVYSCCPEIPTDMPLAGHERPIACDPKHLGDCRGVGAQETLIGGGAEVGTHVADARLMRIKTGEERCTSRAATGAVIHRGDQRPVASQRVY